MSKPTWTQVTETATQPAASWGLRDVTNFHYFNPRGLYARKRANDARIRELVNAGVVCSGWHVAYGTLASFEADELVALHGALREGKRPGRTAVTVTLKMLREHCKKVEQKIAEVQQEAAA